MTLSPLKRLRRRGDTVYGTTILAMSAAAAACLLALAAPAQILGTTNTLDNVLMTTPMWSLADPFGFTVLSNVETMVSDNNAAHMALSNTVSGVTASNALFNAWFAGIFPQTNNWNAAFAWGDWSASVASNTAAIVVLQTNAVPVTATNGWVVTSHDGFITTNDADRIVFNALSTNRVTRWYDPELPTRWAEWDGGTNIVIYKVTSNGVNIAISGSVVADGTYTPVDPESGYLYVGPVPFVIKLEYGVVNLWNTDIAASVANSDNAVAPYGPWNNGVEMLPITSVFSSYSVVTNVEYRYFLPTNAIPPELENLDNLQGWLNNLYAMKSVVDGHITDGTHMNVTLAGTVTIGGVARTDWPEEADLTTPYTQWTGVVTPANGTATVAYAHGNMPVLTVAGATVLTLDPAGYGTGGVSRVSLTLWTGTNTLTLATNVVSYAATPTVSTNAWNTILFRRAGNSSWKGVGL